MAKKPENPFSIDLRGRSGAELELHEKFTVYFDAFRLFIRSHRGGTPSSASHTDFYDATNGGYNYLLTYVRDHIDMVSHPSYNAQPRQYEVSEACVTPLGALALREQVAKRQNIAPQMDPLSTIIDGAIAYVRRQADM